jgi:hypothetical protein
LRNSLPRDFHLQKEKKEKRKMKKKANFGTYVEFADSNMSFKQVPELAELNSNRRF